MSDDAALDADATLDADESSTTESKRRGRRRRRATPTIPDPRGPVAVLVAVAVAAAVVAAGAAVPRIAPAQVPPPVVEPIDASAVICPEPGGVDGAQATSSFTIVPDLPGQDRAGSASLEYLGVPDKPVDAVSIDGSGLSRPGAAVEVVNSAGRERALVARGEGGLAPGLVAAQYELGLAGSQRGLATLACPSPSPTWWFVGGGSTTGRATTLFLVNPDTADAEVDVTLAGPEGPIEARSLRGLVIPAQTRTPIRLTRVAPQVQGVAWQVQVRTGRVVAALQDVNAEGLLPRGVDWIPPSAEPSTTVYVPGVLGGEGQRRLLVHAPGEANATVSVRILATDGAYTPLDLPTVEVAGGTVALVDLVPALQGAAATVELRSDQPIVAGVQQRHDGVDATAPQELQDISFATGARAVSTVAAVTGLPSVRGTAATLWFTVPRPASTPTEEDPAGVDGATQSDDSTTQVTLRVLPFGPGLVESEPLQIQVPFDRAFPVTIPRIEGASWFTVIITPGDRPVYVAQTSLRRGARGTLFSGYPVTPLRTTVSIPSAGYLLPLAVPGG